jgi:predicted TIM-barrel fold metal-dependent hydrolase
MTATRQAIFVDADGHVLEHPHEMVEYAPAAWKDRIWHIETDATGTEWMIMNDERLPAAGLALVGTAGMSAEDRARALAGELRYTDVRPAAFNAAARMKDLDLDGIDLSVLYPTYLLGIHGHRDVEFADIQCRTYNDWLSDHVAGSDGRLYGVALVPQQDIERSAREIRRVAKKPGIVGILLRPNPTADWRQLSDPVYEPIWQAACDADLAIGFHPYLDARLPGACLGLRINRVRS